MFVLLSGGHFMHMKSQGQNQEYDIIGLGLKSFAAIFGVIFGYALGLDGFAVTITVFAGLTVVYIAFLVAGFHTEYDE